MEQQQKQWKRLMVVSLKDQAIFKHDEDSFHKHANTMKLTTFELITLNTLRIYGAHQIRQFNWLCIYINKLAFYLCFCHHTWTLLRSTAILLNEDTTSPDRYQVSFFCDYWNLLKYAYFFSFSWNIQIFNHFLEWLTTLNRFWVFCFKPSYLGVLEFVSKINFDFFLSKLAKHVFCTIVLVENKNCKDIPTKHVYSATK